MSKRNRDVDSIEELEERVLANRKNLNDILPIIEQLTSDNVDAVVRCIHSLYRIFESFIKNGFMAGYVVASEDSPENVAAKWTRQIYDKFIDSLCVFLGHESKRINTAAVKALVDLYRDHSLSLSQRGKAFLVDVDLLKKILVHLLALDEKAVSFQIFISFFFNEYEDVRFYTLKCTEKIIDDVLNGKQASKTLLCDTIFALLSELREFDDEFGKFFVMPIEDIEVLAGKQTQVLYKKYHKRAYSNAWLKFLRLPLNDMMFKKVLAVTHEKLIQNMSDPRLLHDFLTESYNQGGTTSLLALQGLFTLITKYNLDYPEFYEKLYALFDRNMIHSNYRGQFLKLANLFLRSTHLPSYLVAAFIKRMTRLCLYATPPGIVGMLAIVYRLLKEHPACLVLIHRPYTVEEGADESSMNENDDPYIAEEEDLKRCRAMESSLWELTTLESHAVPAVSSFIKKFKDPFNAKAPMAIIVQDHLDKPDLDFYMEVNRGVSKPPALVDNVQGKGLFPENSLLASYV